MTLDAGRYVPSPTRSSYPVPPVTSQQSTPARDWEGVFDFLDKIGATNTRTSESETWKYAARSDGNSSCSQSHQLVDQNLSSPQSLYDTRVAG